MAHAFISYVRENADQIDQLALALYRRGIDTWIDRDIRPGYRWESAIRDAITSGASFLPCFSSEAVAKTETYMHDELGVAIGVLRGLPSDSHWLIPVRLSECHIPDLDIGAGRSLRDLQWVDMFPNWEAGVARIVVEVGQALTHEQRVTTATEPRLPTLRRAPSPETVNAWRAVWSALFALQVAGEDLFAHIDTERVAEYARCLERAVDTIGKVAFFFEKDDFTDVNSLLQGALAFRSGKESVRSMKDSQVNVDITKVIRGNLHEFERFCWLLSDMRTRYSMRTASSPQHLSTHRDARYDTKIRALEARVARSQRTARIRKAVASMVQRGEISTDSECPRGHGRLRDWESLPRCWTCGWPWTDIEPASTSQSDRS